VTPAAGAASRDDDYRLLHAAAYLALFCVGVYAASFGPALPFLADDLGVSLDGAGLLLTGLFAGSITASGIVAVALHGVPTRVLAIAGLSLAACGLLLLGLAGSWPLAMIGAVLLGTGDGLVIASLHMLMAVTSRDVPAAMNRLNIYFAVGAVAGAVGAGAVLELDGGRAAVYGAIAALVAATFTLMVMSRGPAAVPIAAGDRRLLPGNPTAWLMGVVLFFYVGAEFGLGSWVSTYARETTGASVFAAAVLTAGYWAALFAGRLVAGRYFARGGDAGILLTASVAGAGLSALLLAATTGNVALSAAAAFGAGLCLGPVWPCTLAIASRDSPANTAAATVTLGNAGGLLIPWLQGKILVGAGPREGVLVTVLLAAVMLATMLAFQLSRTRGRPRGADQGAVPGAGGGTAGG
jgi:fucose permease